MTGGKVITGTLHRLQRGHGKRFAADPPPVIAAVHRPARVAIMLALAHKIDDAVTRGQLADQAEAARCLGLTRARVTQLLSLLTLAPDIQEQVLFLEAIDGLEPLTEHGLRHVTCARNWAEQRALLETVLAPRGMDAQSCHDRNKLR